MIHTTVFALVLLCCDAQEFSFTASCGNDKLSTSVDDKLDKLIDILFGDLSLSNSSVFIDEMISKKINDLTHLPPPSYVPGSCKDIQNKWPTSTSGYYTIATANGHTSTVYCHMEELCNTPGPWTRVAHLNMKDHLGFVNPLLAESEHVGERLVLREVVLVLSFLLQVTALLKFVGK